MKISDMPKRNSTEVSGFGSSELALGISVPLTRPLGGLVWAFTFDSAGMASPVPEDADLIFPPNSGWLWLHLDLVDTRAQDWIKQYAPISEYARDCLIEGARRQFLASNDGEIHGVIADFYQEFNSSSYEVGRLYVALTDRLVLSGRRHPLQSVDILRTKLGGTGRIARPVDFLAETIEQFASAVTGVSAALAEEVDDAEDRMFMSDGSEDRSRLNEIRRASLQIHREVNALRTALRRFRTAHSKLGPEELHRMTDQLGAILEEADHDLLVVQDRVRLVLDELAGKAAAAANRHLHVLSVLTALFMPATLVAGLFGMNVKNIPFQDDDRGFWSAFIVAASLTLVVYLYLRRKRIIQ